MLLAITDIVVIHLGMEGLTVSDSLSWQLCSINFLNMYFVELDYMGHG